MSYRLPSHLHRNRHGVLYFRLAVPADVQPITGQKEIYRSLNTASVRQAANAAQTLRIACGAIFTDLRTLTTPEEEQTALERWEAFTKLPDLRQRINIAGLKIARDEDQRRLISQENEIVRNQEQHKHDLDIAKDIASRSTAIPEAPKPTITIMEVWELYKAEKINGGSWKDGENSSKREHEPHVRTFCKAIGGNKPIANVTPEDVETFVQFVLIENPNETGTNKKKRITRAGALFRWAKRKRKIVDAFAELFQFEGKIIENSYHKFSPEDLKALFESEDYRQHRFKNPSEYWLPLLGLFTGGRLNELAQLTCSDIGVHDGIQTISVLDEDGKRLKNEFSRRVIPIHSKLIELGFLDYVARTGNGRIFPELTASKEKPGDFGREPSRRFTAYRRRCGVGTEKFNAESGKWEGNSVKVFHSFRSTLISSLRKAGVPQERRERLAGHESEGTNNKNYDGGDALTMFDFSMLKADIENASYNVGFTPFTPVKGTESTQVQ